MPPFVCWVEWFQACLYNVHPRMCGAAKSTQEEIIYFVCFVFRELTAWNGIKNRKPSINYQFSQAPTIPFVNNAKYYENCAHFNEFSRKTALAVKL